MKTKSLFKVVPMLMLLCSSLATSFAAPSDGGELIMNITSKATGKALTGATASLWKNGEVMYDATAIDGVVTISGIVPGTYDLIVEFISHRTDTVKAVYFTSGVQRFIDRALRVEGEEVTGISIVWQPPVIDEGQLSLTDVLTGDRLNTLPTLSPVETVKTMKGVYSQDNGSNSLHFNGARSTQNMIMVDGVRIANLDLPSAAIAEVKVTQSGISARYGDFIGGLVEITTISP